MTKNKTFIICICIWVTVTLSRLITHQPWTDEVWAWILAQNLNPIQLLTYLKNEGHTFIWYSLLMPFAKTNFAYPYSMLILNWIFCLGAILTMWKWAPFNNFLKIVIMFSFPFFAYYPVVARCYSIGILLLFILAAMYKDKLKHPIIYSVLILICANTSVMAGIGSFCFGVLLAYDLIKHKQWKDFKIASALAVLCSILIAVQFVGVTKQVIKSSMLLGLSKNFFLDVFIFSQWINGILLCVFGLLLLKAFFKNKQALFFLVVTYSLLLLLFNYWYLGDFWHHYFFYIYLICGTWIYFNNENVALNSKKIISSILIIISTLFIFDFHYEPRVFRSQSKVLANFIEEHKNSRIIFFDHIFFSTIPYLTSNDYEIYDFEINNFINKKKVGQVRNHKITYDSIEKIILKNKTNYGFFNECRHKEDLHKNKKTIKFILVKNIKNGYCIYEIKHLDKN